MSIIKLETRLLEKFKSSPFSVNDLNEQVKIIAPKFLDVDSILNYVSVAPLIINLAFHELYLRIKSVYFHNPLIETC